jgi:type III pantothenate kinase
MLLCIDVGNTETKLGAFDHGGALIGTWRVTTARRRTADEFGVLFQAFFSAAKFETKDIEAILVSSVVPVVDRPLAEGCDKYFGVKPTFFSAATQRSIVIKTDRPRELGSDLAAAAIGAVGFIGAPAIVINYGTATTFGAIDRDGAYVGVAIATGLQVSLDALVGRTAKLPQVALVAPESAIGRETVSAIQSGLVFGAVGQTEEMVRRFRATLGDDARVIASGGMSPVVAAETDVIEIVEPHLVLHGLRNEHLRGGV